MSHSAGSGTVNVDSSPTVGERARHARDGPVGVAKAALREGRVGGDAPAEPQRQDGPDQHVRDERVQEPVTGRFGSEQGQTRAFECVRDDRPADEDGERGSERMCAAGSDEPASDGSGRSVRRDSTLADSTASTVVLEGREGGWARQSSGGRSEDRTTYGVITSFPRNDSSMTSRCASAASSISYVRATSISRSPVPMR